MNRIGAILKKLLLSRFGSIAAGLVIAILLIWIGGPYIGLKSVSMRLVVIAACVIVFLAYVFIRWLIDKRRGKQLEEDLEDAAMLGTRAGREAEIASLRKQMQDAISALKASELGSSRKGGAALYALPWYMIIGPSAAGKSTILRNSGLNFPYSNHDPRGIQGLGGTRNCDWWFSDQAIFLDTAGRYTTEDEDREEWFAFLEMLRKNRTRQPVNGVLIAVSIADLLTCDSEAVERHAKVIRERIDELINELGLLFPVYVIFTKSDLIRGFTSFFDELSEQDREQVWGASMLAVDSKDQREPGEVFAEEFQALYSRLCSHRLHKLGLERSVERKAQIVDFPNQFFSAATRLEEFIQQVFKKTPYKETPVFSGFYFTSGAQEGTPIERIVGSLVDAYGAVNGASMSASESEQKPFFIHRLLKDVVLPNSRQAMRNRKSEFRSRWIKRTAMVTSLCLMAGSIMIYSTSFTRKMLLISDVQESTDNLAAALVHKEPEMQEVLKRLVQYYTTTGELWADEFRQVSLYKPSGFESPLGQNFLAGMETLFLAPVAYSLEYDLTAYVEDVRARPASLNNSRDPLEVAKNSRRTARAYEALKLYLYLGTPEVVESEHVDEGFVRAWLSALKRMGLRLEEYDTDVLASMARFYIFSMKEKSGAARHARAWEHDRGLISQVRTAIRQVPGAERYYADLRDLGSRKYSSIDLVNLLGGHHRGMLVSKYSIPGIYTKKAWKEFVWPYLESARKSSSSNDWVLGADSDFDETHEELSRAKLVKQLRELYFADYAEHWFAMLGSVSSRRFDSLRDASSQLQRVVKQEGPIGSFYKSVLDNIEIVDPESSTIIAIESKDEGNQTGIALDLIPELKVPFKYLQRIVRSGLSSREDAWLPQYLKSLEAIQADIAKLATSSDVSRDTRLFATKIMDGDTETELYRSWLTINHLLEDVDTRTAQAMASALRAPLKNVWGTMVRVAQRDLQMTWKNQVQLKFNETLSSRYPFAGDGRDASLQDVIEFFRPGSGVFWTFVNNDLRPFVEKRGNKWEARKWVGIGMEFEPHFLDIISRTARVTSALFQAGDAQPRFAFSIYPYPNSKLSESAINIDGSRYRYRNGPQEWQRFEWPGASPGARVQGVRAGSLSRAEVSTDGTWAWLRLLDRAYKRGNQSGSSFTASWNMQDTMGQKINVKFQIRPDRATHPFQKNVLRGYRLPAGIFPRTEIVDALTEELKNPG